MYNFILLSIVPSINLGVGLFLLLRRRLFTGTALLLVLILQVATVINISQNYFGPEQTIGIIDAAESAISFSILLLFSLIYGLLFDWWYNRALRKLAPENINPTKIGYWILFSIFPILVLISYFMLSSLEQ